MRFSKPIVVSYVTCNSNNSRQDLKIEQNEIATGKPRKNAIFRLWRQKFVHLQVSNRVICLSCVFDISGRTDKMRIDRSAFGSPPLRACRQKPISHYCVATTNANLLVSGRLSPKFNPTANRIV